MDNTNCDTTDKESSERRNSNSEWLPTKCRITKPPPPKPATNPLQFVKVAPCPLFKKAHEQIKKVEEIKIERHAVKEEAEEWQQNLDNWKSSRRKMQEHIIERVGEVKKLEQEDVDRSRRKSKTFNEILQGSNKRGHILNIPIFDDDANDLSDYGIGSSSSKTNSIKDVDTDDSSSYLDDKYPEKEKFNSRSDKNCSSTSNQSEDEFLGLTSTSLAKSNHKPRATVKPIKPASNTQDQDEVKKKVYTYEEAIADYRSKIIQNADSDARIMCVQFDKEADHPVPIIDVLEYKSKFEGDFEVEVTRLDFELPKRRSEELTISLGTSERLKHLAKDTGLQITPVDNNAQGSPPVVTTSKKLANQSDISIQIKNNNLNYSNRNNAILSNNKADERLERCRTLEIESDMCKLNKYLESYLIISHSPQTSLGDSCEQTAFPHMVTTEVVISSDREDSGVHTADVSSAVSQADESVEYNDELSTTIPNCIEKLQKERERELSNQNGNLTPKLEDFEEHFNEIPELEDFETDYKISMQCTQDYLDDSKHLTAEQFYTLDELNTFSLAPPKMKEPPKEKPPPPPATDDEKPKQSAVQRSSSTKRIKKEMHIKRSSFLGLEELYRNYTNSHEVCSSEVDSQDSGLESEKGRLSSDIWCSGVGESSMSSHDRQDSQLTNNSEEDEIAKKEREIIALVEKEEKSKDSNTKTSTLACCNMVYNIAQSKNVQIPYVTKKNPKNKIPLINQDSELLRIKHKDLQFEKELEQQKENTLFRETGDKLLQNNRYSFENICDASGALPQYYENISCRKSMSECRKEVHTGSYQKWKAIGPSVTPGNRAVSSIDTCFRKSMPDIQQAYLGSVDMNNVHNKLQLPLEHGKSMPELQKAMMPALTPYQSFSRPVMPGAPVTSLIMEERDKQKALMSLHETSTAHYQNIKPEIPVVKLGRSVLSAVPKQRNLPSDNWIQPKLKEDTKCKSYNKHWLYQEAELRRLTEQQITPLKGNNYQPVRQEQHIPTPIIESLTQRVQNMLPFNERMKCYRSENEVQNVTPHTTYPNRPHTVGHESPVVYPPTVKTEHSEGKLLSVSGKKKCSFCRKELGRGAAMIIESLCLFYHVDCFKCCVCHIPLGDGLIGTDVRVRNKKLHCHNCYTSDDGIKFSCV